MMNVQYRELHFPEDRPFGWLHVYPADAPEDVDWVDNWFFIAELQGIVQVPARLPYRVTIRLPASTDLSPLAQFRADDVRSLDLSQTIVSDEQLVHVSHLTGIRLLGLSDTEVTDQGIAHLRHLVHLRHLWLWHCRRITDAGLVVLRGMPELRGLFLGRTPITDAGLAHLQGLARLHTLVLDETAITDVGLLYLLHLPRLSDLNLAETAVTDAGLMLLRQMPQLRDIDLEQSGVTNEGIEQLKQDMPRLFVHHDQSLRHKAERLCGDA